MRHVVRLDVKEQSPHGEEGVPVKVAARWAIDTAFDLWQFAHPIKNPKAPVSNQRAWQAPE